MGVDEIVSKIVKATGKSESEVRELIKRKRAELANLVSEEGAAYLVAKELGLELVKKRVYRLKLKNLVGDMRNVNLVARVLRVEPKEFRKSDGSVGKLASIYLGDETGVVRLVLWGEEAKACHELARGDIIAITNGVTKERFGSVELGLGRYGFLKRLEASELDFELPSCEEIEAKFGIARASRAYERKEIKELKRGDAAKLVASIVQVFDVPPVFYACPICGKRLAANETCDEHGASSAIAVLSGVIDDGTGNLRFVAFREQALSLLGVKSCDELKGARSALEFGEKLLGKEFELLGYVKLNKLFGKLEFVVNEAREVNWESELKRSVGEVEKLISSVQSCDKVSDF